ncbi:MAG: hypothetical protein P8I27_00885 [Pirellulaceae bacterium]|nr:hypothetical protein [Pirellulaceae bacterium]
MINQLSSFDVLTRLEETKRTKVQVALLFITLIALDCNAQTPKANRRYSILLEIEGQSKQSHITFVMPADPTLGYSSYSAIRSLRHVPQKRL